MTSFVDDNGNYLDYSGADLIHTKQVASFYDFKLKGDFTIDFKLPNTARNRDTLGYYGPQQIVSPAFSQNPFTIVRDGNAIVRGYLILKGSDKDNIDAFFVSGNTNWFDVLQFNVRDIVFDPRFTIAWDTMDTQKTATEGIVFPAVDWCYNGNRRSRSINLQNFHEAIGPTDYIQEAFPCLYMHTLVSQMANHAGISIGGDLTSDPIYKRILITPAGPDMSISDALIKHTVCSTGMSADQVTPATGPFDTVYDIGDLAKYDKSTYRYRCPIKGVYKVVVDYTIVSGTINIQANQLRGGSSYATLLWYSGPGQTAGNMVFNFACDAGDELSVTGAGGGLMAANTTAIYSLEDSSKPYYIYNNGASSYLVACTGLVMPNAICPDLTGVDLLKALCVMFGAYCTYDEYAKVISLNKISKLKRENAKDWSKYYVSHYNNYQTGVATNNFIKYQDTPEVGLLPYNQENVAGYGGWNLQTSFEQVAYKTVYKLPFAGAWDQHPKMMVGWYLPYIKFYELSDDKSVTWNFTSVTNSGGDAAFTSGAGDQPFKAGDLVRITGTFYSGYGIVANSYNTFTISCNYIDYIATDTGIITKVTYTPVNTVNRLLLASPGANVSDFGAAGFGFYYGAGLTSVAYSTTCMAAWFDRPKMGLGIDSNTDSLALDTISNRDYNTTLSERYHQYIENIYNNPTVKAKMTLPTSVFQSFLFDSFIYLKTESLTGYFFVQKIEWRDSVTECNVELLYID